MSVIMYCRIKEIMQAYLVIHSVKFYYLSKIFVGKYLNKRCVREYKFRYA